MVAVIHTSCSLRRAFNYNEQKVKAGVAVCILAENYLKEVEALTLSQKLNRLLNQAESNVRVKRNSMHISLNFDPSEKLSQEQLTEIAQTYMQKIGFGEQPYLVYQHHDAGHPHLHLVTVKIRADGTRINTQNIGRNQSVKARQEIEQTFGLVKAKDHSKRQVYTLEPVSVQKVHYGKSQTRSAIAQVLNRVLQEYKYTSLPELNAVLQQYNVAADRGSENSKVYQNKGLLYRVLDAHGNRVGVPIKASAFYQQPTLKYLEARFKQNQTAREPHKARVKNAIDLAFFRQPNTSLTELTNHLKKEGIDTVLRRNESGRIYGITYVDHRTKNVFKGSDLGKNYGANTIQARCGLLVPHTPNITIQPDEKRRPAFTDSDVSQGEKSSLYPAPIERQQAGSNSMVAELNKILETFLQPEQTFDYVPAPLKVNRKKKKQKRINRPF